MLFICIALIITASQCLATTPTLHLDCKLNYLICTSSLQLNDSTERCACLEELGTCLGKFELGDDNIALITRECTRLSCTYICEYENEVAKANGVAVGTGLGIAFGIMLLLVLVVGGVIWWCNRQDDKKDKKENQTHELEEG